MSKPWEDRWFVELETTDSDGEPCTPSYLIRQEDGGERPLVAEAWSEASAKLAAAAPEMARLLREWMAEGSFDQRAVERALLRAGVPLPESDG